MGRFGANGQIGCQQNWAPLDHPLIELRWSLYTHLHRWSELGEQQQLVERSAIDQWYGVTTDANGRVSELNLHDNQLTGSVPADLGNLSNLTYLSLRRQLPSLVSDVEADPP